MDKKYSLNEVNTLIEKLKKKKGLKSKGIINNNEKGLENEKNKEEKSYILNKKNEKIINENNKSMFEEKNLNSLKNSSSSINEPQEKFKNTNMILKKNNEKNLFSNNIYNNKITKNKNIILELSLTNKENPKNIKFNTYNSGGYKIKTKNVNYNIKDVNKDNKNSIEINKEKNKSINNNTLSENNKEISLFKNIYNNFSINFTNKENVFNTNILDEELKILDLDYEDSIKRKKFIISKNKSINEINKEKIKEKDVGNNINNFNKNSLKFINKYNINKDYKISYENSNKITLQNIYQLLYNEIEDQIYKNYFPVSYDNNIDLLEYINILSLIINDKSKQEPWLLIVAILLKNIFTNNIDLKQVDILKNINIKNEILEILFNSIKISNSNNNNLNLINNNILFNIYNSYNNENLINNNIMKYDLLIDDNNPMNFIFQLFQNSIMNKNNKLIYFYFILLNVKNTNNNIISNEIFEEIFNNFDICLYIILKFINNEDEIRNICSILVNKLFPKMNFCYYIILKIILGKHNILDEKFYGKMFTSFLNFVNIEKLIIADYYNLILFTINSEVKKIFGKCSILIKYKYSLLKQSYEENQNDIILKEKIYKNISQFGKISRNFYFLDYMKNDFCNNEDKKNDEDTIINNNIEQFDYKIENNNNSFENSEQNENGFFSSIKFALGFGSYNSKTEDVSNEINDEKIQINDK